MQKGMRVHGYGKAKNVGGDKQCFKNDGKNKGSAGEILKCYTVLDGYGCRDRKGWHENSSKGNSFGGVAGDGQKGKDKERNKNGGEGCYEKSIKGNSLGGVEEEGKVCGEGQCQNEKPSEKNDGWRWHGQSGSYPSLTKTKWHVSKSSWMMTNQMLVKYAVNDKGDDSMMLQNVKTVTMSSPKSPKKV